MRAKTKNIKWHLWIAIALPMAAMLAWHAKSDFYPQADAGDFMADTQDDYLKLKQDGPIGALDRIYFKRGLRPISHPHIVSVFMAATGGDARLTLKLSLIAFFLLFIFFIAKIFDLYLSRAQCVLGTWYIGMLGYITHDYATFMSEMFFVAAATATLFYLLRMGMEFTRSDFAKCAVFLALSLTVRPVEALLFLLPMLVLFLTREKLFPRKQLLILCAFAGANLAILVGSALLLKRNLSPLECLVAVIAEGGLLARLALFWKKKRMDKDLLLFFMLVHGLVFLWYVPQVHQLLFWVNLSNFSEIAINKGGRENIGTLGFLWKMLQNFGFMSLVAFALVIAETSISRKLAPLDKKTMPLALYAALGFGIALTAILTTYNGDDRYYHFLYTLMQIGLFTVATIVLGRAMRYGPWLLAAIPLAQALLLANILFPPKFDSPFDYFLKSTLKNPPSTIDNADFTRAAIDALAKKTSLPKTSFLEPTLHLNMMSYNWPVPNDQNMPSIEQWALRLRSRELGYHWIFVENDYQRSNDVEKIIKDVTRNHDYYLVSTIWTSNLHDWAAALARKIGFAKTEIAPVDAKDGRKFALVLFSRR